MASQGQLQIERYLKRGLKIRHLRVLLAVAELGRIGKVAEYFHVTQPAISKQIAEVESALGVRLFDRSGHALKVTGAGEHMVRSAATVLMELEGLARRLDGLGEGITGRVSLGGVATPFVVLVPDAVARFKQQAPHAAVHLIEGAGDELLTALRVGEIDLFVGRLSRRAVATELQYEDVLSDPVVIACGIHHPLARRTELDWSDVLDQEWILPPADLHEYRAFMHWLERQGVRPGPSSVESRSILANLSLVATTDLLMPIPQRIAQTYAAQQRLAILPLPPGEVLGPLQLVWNQGRLGPAGELMADCLRAAARAVRPVS